MDMMALGDLTILTGILLFLVALIMGAIGGAIGGILVRVRLHLLTLTPASRYI